MGELNDEEMQEVDRMVALYPAVKQELEELRSTLVDYAKGTGMQPSAEVLEGAIEAIREEEKENFVRVLHEEPEMKVQRINAFPLWSIAASILLFVSLGFNIFFFSQWETTKDELQLVSRQNNFLADQIETTNQTLENANMELDYAALRIAHFLNKDNLHVRMDGTNLSPDSFANVFWNTKTNSVFISVDNLPEPPHGHQYQLWAIKAGQAPIDAGIFDHNKLIQELKVIKGQVAAFAVTLEVEGGTPNATVDKTYVKGFLKSS